MANRYKKKKKPVNKAKGWVNDYYQTGREWDRENRRRRQEAGEEEPRGLKNLTGFEKGCIAVIIIALIGFFIKLVVLKHDFWTPGI